MSGPIPVAVVVFLVWVVMQYVVAPLVKLFLADGSAGQVTVTRALSMLLGVGFLMLDVGMPSQADGGAWVQFLGSGIVSGLAAMGVHVGVSGTQQAIQTIASRRSQAKASKAGREEAFMDGDNGKDRPSPQALQSPPPVATPPTIPPPAVPPTGA